MGNGPAKAILGPRSGRAPGPARWSTADLGARIRHHHATIHRAEAVNGKTGQLTFANAAAVRRVGSRRSRIA